MSQLSSLQKRFQQETRDLVSENRMLKTNIDKLVDQIEELKRKIR